MTDEQADMWRAVAAKTSYAEFAKKVPTCKALIEKALAVK